MSTRTGNSSFFSWSGDYKDQEIKVYTETLQILHTNRFTNGVLFITKLHPKMDFKTF